jgi:hypothetical protein
MYKVEGVGFDSPEEAARAYLEGLRDSDLNHMMSTFAVESYVEKFNWEAYFSHLSFYQYQYDIWLPNDSESFVAMNTESSRRAVFNSIIGHIFSLGELGFDPNRYRFMNKKDADDLAALLNAKLAASRFQTLEIIGFIPHDVLYEEYAGNPDPNSAFMKHLAKLYESICGGMDRMAFCAIVFRFEKNEYILGLEALNYGGKWYIGKLGGEIFREWAAGTIPATARGYDEIRKLMKPFKSPALGTGIAPKQKYEGVGFDSPEKAARAYIEGLRDSDLNRMMSAFAVESFAENYDAQAYWIRYSYYIQSEMPLPNTNKFFTALNIESRRKKVFNMIQTYYLSMCEGQPWSLPRGFILKNETNARDLSNELNTYLGASRFQPLEIIGFIPQKALSGKFDPRVLDMMASLGAERGADKLESCAVVFRLDENEYIFCIDTVNYGDNWYISNLGGFISSIIKVGEFSSGLIPATADGYDEIRKFIMAFD